jgi:hypothetical protein
MRSVHLRARLRPAQAGRAPRPAAPGSPPASRCARPLLPRLNPLPASLPPPPPWQFADYGLTSADIPKAVIKSFYKYWWTTEAGSKERSKINFEILQGPLIGKAVAVIAPTGARRALPAAGQRVCAPAQRRPPAGPAPGLACPCTHTPPAPPPLDPQAATAALRSPSLLSPAALAAARSSSTTRG